MAQGRAPVIVALGSAQALAWGSSYYLPAVLATPMARDLGVTAPTVFAAFSAALVISGLLGPAVGRTIDRVGGRSMLMATNVVFAVSLVALAAARGPVSLFAAWALMGIAMGAGLYESAFATLVRLYGSDSRDAITGITLIAGFASTIAWPLSSALDAEAGWRVACLTWAALHLVIALPLNASVPRVLVIAPTPQPDRTAHAATVGAERPRDHRHRGARGDTLTAALLGYVFAATWFVATAMAAHLPRMLEAAGASFAVAVGIGTLVGPSQVAGRLLEFGFLRHVSPLLSARLAALAHPLGALVLLACGASYAAAFAVLHGIGVGILTIAKGTLPLLLFGPEGYGARQGWLSLPSRVTQALAPLAFGVALDRLGSQAVWLSAAVAASAFVTLCFVSVRPTSATRAATA